MNSETTPPRRYAGRKYEVQQYDPAWPQQFEHEADLVREAFNNKAIAIEHIGSTSVPGMKGKPLIDLLVLVDDIQLADDASVAMEKAGYTPYGDLLQKGGRLFIRENGHEKLVNVHSYELNHPHVAEMLDLRDYLRSHPDEVQGYSDLKQELFEKYPDDYASYRKEKDAYMADLKERVKHASQKSA